MCPRSADLGRRELLAGLGAGALGSTAGCVDSLFRRLSRSGPEQLSLTITTLPAADDSGATRVGRQLNDNLQEAGIAATIDLKDDEYLLRDALMDHDFDIFVAKHPGVAEPDDLWALLHSQFMEESGWQNPFGFSDDTIDELLEKQRRPGERDRETVVAELQRRLLELQPFSVIAYPDHLGVARADLETERVSRGLNTPLDYLQIGQDNPEIETLRVGLLDSNATVNRNPLAVEYRTREAILDLVYEPLAQRLDSGEVVPWLAEEVEWEPTPRGQRARITLRTDQTWHDGEPLTADDVAFTYRFLADTAMDGESGAVPAPRFRGESSLVEDVEANGRTVDLELGTTVRRAAVRALQVPILPEHVWSEMTELTSDFLTEAVVTDNEEPIGSGLFRFVDATESQEIVFERNDDHFLRSGSVEEPLELFADGPTYERLEFQVPPNSGAAFQLLEDEELHAIASSVRTEDVERVRENPDIDLLEGETNSFYLVGFNHRRHPMHNHKFRAAIAQLIDREFVATEVFDGHAAPSDSVLERTAYMQNEFVWTGSSRVGPFPGEEGEIDQEQVRELFREAGFRYADDGALLTQE